MTTLDKGIKSGSRASRSVPASIKIGDYASLTKALAALEQKAPEPL